MLDDVELQQVQTIEVEGEQVLSQHDVPALEGDFVQRLDRHATRLTLAGVLTGADARDGLEKLRAKFRAAAPVPFVADIATATTVDQVLIEELGVRELAGKPERFEYAFTLCEYIAPPEPEETAASRIVDDQVREEATARSTQQVDEIANQTATLEVEVELSEGDDYTGIVVVVEGTTTAGQAFAAQTSEQDNGTYRFIDIPAGTYTVRLELQ